MRACCAVLVTGLTAALVACGPPPRGEADAPPGDDDTPDATTNPADAPLPPFMGAVFAHSYFNLYKIDPDSLQVMLIGPFHGPDWNEELMTDIAVDKDENIVGISFGALYAVNKMTAECTFLATLSGEQFNGLTYRPNPAGAEILIGTGLGGTLWEIDPTGATPPTQTGAYGGNIISSGDMVSIENYGTIATVKAGSEMDYLARIDDTTGAATIIGPTGYYDIWGVGYWRNKAFGFVATNEFVLIDVATGAATFITDGPENWTGAGVTTRAPIEP